MNCTNRSRGLLSEVLRYVRRAFSANERSLRARDITALCRASTDQRIAKSEHPVEIIASVRVGLLSLTSRVLSTVFFVAGWPWAAATTDGHVRTPYRQGSGCLRRLRFARVPVCHQSLAVNAASILSQIVQIIPLRLPAGLSGIHIYTCSVYIIRRSLLTSFVYQFSAGRVGHAERVANWFIQHQPSFVLVACASLFVCL